MLTGKRASPRDIRTGLGLISDSLPGSMCTELTVIIIFMGNMIYITPSLWNNTLFVDKQ